MKKTRIILAILVFALVAGIAAGCFFWMNTREAPNSEHLDWVWIPQTYKLGALSEEGYYYGSYLSYCDFSTGEHVVLCSKVGCSHEDYDCDAYTGTRNGQEMYFEDGYLYYVGSDSSGRHVFRRDATGAALVTGGTPGEYYTKQKKSVDIDAFTLADGYLFYSGRVGTDLGDTVTLDTEFIARMNLVTGKEEILVEVQMENPGDHLWLCAVRGNGAIYTRYITPDMDREDSAYSDALLQSVNKLYMWSEETGESVVLLEKPIREFSLVSAVYGGKVFYKSLSVGTVYNTDLYAYDLTTGKDQKWISGRLTHLGGGYALRKLDEEGNCDLINLLTKEKLPNVLNQIADGGTGNMRCVSRHGVLLNWWGIEHRKENEDDISGYRDDHSDYITYASLADGLQQEDLIPVFKDEIYINDPNITPPSTGPDETKPTEPDDSVTPIIFETMSPIPNDQVTTQIQFLPESVENPDGLPVLKWVILSDIVGMNTTYREDAVHDLNQMLADKNMPYRIQLILMKYHSEADDFSYMDWFSNPEVKEVLKDADLIYANMTPDQQQQYLMPITDYVIGEAQPALENAVPHESVWGRTTVDGVIYGIPSSVYNPVSVGWIVDEAFLRQSGLTADDFDVELWEMDELLDKLTKANGGQGVIDLCDDTGFSWVRSMLQISNAAYIPFRYQQIGALFAVDLAAETPTVVNLLEEEPFQKMRMAALRYRASGYVFKYDPDNPELKPKVYLTYVPGNSVFVESGQVFIPGGPTRDPSEIEHKNVIGIAAASQNQEEAISLLNLIAEDEKFRDQLCYGTEGQDYNITNDVVSQIIETTTVKEVTEEKLPDGSTVTSTKTYEKWVLYDMSDLSPLSGFGRLNDGSKRCYEGKTKLETHREMAESASYFDFPIVFDFSELTEELEEMGYALGKYLQNGNFSGLKSMSEDEYAKLLQEVKTDGGDKIVAELQRQLDDWLANNPDWQ